MGRPSRAPRIPDGLTARDRRVKLSLYRYFHRPVDIMDPKNDELELRRGRNSIAKRVRALRKERRWTQAELSQKLNLSQSRLSEIERGDGSFTAEQFLLILKLFNVAASHFVHKATEPDRDAEFQNVLARLGALHLKESVEVLPSERLEAVGDIVRETLVAAESPRLITALAPVLVRNADRINLKKLHLELVGAGFERRLGWLLESTRDAVRAELVEPLPRPWAQVYRRAEVLLSAFVDFARAEGLRGAASAAGLAPDILDRNIRSKRSLDEVVASSSNTSRGWGIVTSLQLEDFGEALRGTRAAG